MDERIVLYQSCGNRGVLVVCLCCDGVGGEWVGGLDQVLEGWSYGCVSPDYLCRWQVQVSVYCAGCKHAHLRCTRVQSCCTLSIAASYHVFVYGRYHKSRIVCVWFGPGFVSTSPVIMRSASHRVCMADLSKTGKSAPNSGAGGFDTIAQQFVTAVTAPLLVGCVVWSQREQHPHWI